MAEKQTSQQPAELKDEALDTAQGGNLGDTATHEVGHVTSRLSTDPRKVLIGIDFRP